MKNSLGNKREYFIIILFIAFLAALLKFVIEPQLLSIQQKRDAIEETKVLGELRMNKVKEIPSLKLQNEKVMNEGAKLKSYVDKEKALDLFKELEVAAEANGLEFKKRVVELSDVDKRREASSKEESLKKDLIKNDYLELDMELIGTYESVFDFISKLENMKYFSDIISFKIEKFQEEQQQRQVSNLFGTIKKETPEEEAPEEGGVVEQVRGKVKATIKGIFYYENNHDEKK